VPHFRFDLLPPQFDAVLVASGSDPGAAVFREVLRRSRIGIAVDGGTAVFRKRKRVPDYVIGDLDSVSRLDLRWAEKSGSKILRARLQQNSDLEKALNFCAKKSLRQVAILASDGNRPDHTMNAFRAVLGMDRLRAVLVTAKAVTYPMRGAFDFEMFVPPKHAISWQGFPRSEKCTIKGVKWPFHNRVLEIGGFQSLSNQSISGIVSFKSAAGLSLITVSLTSS
jgi:thiamine pyrophosphokinase